MTALQTTLTGLQQSLGVALSRAADADVCLSLGRFPAQKTISVTVNLTRRTPPAPPKESNRARMTELARNLLAEIEKGSTDTPAARRSRSATAARAVVRAAEEADEDAEKPEPEKPKPPITQSSSTEFAVL